MIEEIAMARFSINSQSKAQHHVFRTKHLRITLLTPCLLRLEAGEFTDLPTQTVWNRDFPKIKCTWGQEQGIFTLKSEECVFRIDLRRQTMQSIALADGTVVTDFEKGNLLGTARTLDMANGAVKLEKGITSISGASVMDDSKSLLLNPDGSISPRPACSDCYYFAYGRDYLGQLRDFFGLTGEVPLIPKYDDVIQTGNGWASCAPHAAARPWPHPRAPRPLQTAPFRA
jgi:hypothetical protein